MSWQKSWMFISLFALLSPITLEAKVNLSDMNLLTNVEIQSTQDALIINFIFNKNLKYIPEPIFYDKSIQVDFPRAYSQPAKKFLTTGNTQISQIYVSQFNPRKMRVRFILGKGAKENYENRFHLQKNNNTLTVSVDLKQTDLLDQLLARATKKTEEKKQLQPTNKVDADIKNKPTNIETGHSQVKSAIMTDPNNFKNKFFKKNKTTPLKKKPQWKEDKGKPENLKKHVKQASFNVLNSGDKKQSEPAGLISSSLKMIMTLSLVLGLIFLLFFGFKKYVLKNTVFGGGKLIQVVSTNYLAPKKNITLVEVAGEILVLGVSDQNISLLTSIREPERIEEIKNTHGDSSNNANWQKGISGEITGKVSLATSNAKKMFSNYLNDFSNSESSKEASVAAVTEKIRRQKGKVRSA